MRLIYVLLDSPERNIERVRLRVLKGGHDVPEVKVRERYARSLAELFWFLEQADQAWIYDNSGGSPKLNIEKREGEITARLGVLPALVQVLRQVAARWPPPSHAPP